MATSRKASAQVANLEDGVTTIGRDIQVKGRIEGEEDLRVEGRVEGAIGLSETLFVAEEGIVLAEVEALDVVVSGVLVGDVTAKNSVTLNPGAKLVGDIEAPRIIIADGAAFQGRVQMGGDMPPPPRERTRSAAAREARSASRSTTTAAPTASTRRAPAARPASKGASKGKGEGEGDSEVTVVVKHEQLRKERAATRRAPPRPAAKKKAAKTATKAAAKKAPAKAAPKKKAAPAAPVRKTAAAAAARKKTATAGSKAKKKARVPARGKRKTGRR